MDKYFQTQIKVFWTGPKKGGVQNLGIFGYEPTKMIKI